MALRQDALAAAEGTAVRAPSLVEPMAAAVVRNGVTPRRFSSRAGHEGPALIALCAGGFRPNPAGAISAEGADIAVPVLVDFRRHFTPPVR